MTSYRYYRLNQLTTNQVDIGGFFPGDKLGTPTSVATRPQQPWYYVAGLTTNITPLTNDFHYSFLRNYWSWSDETHRRKSQAWAAPSNRSVKRDHCALPFNVNTQNIRTRFWDGKDNFFRDNVTS